MSTLGTNDRNFDWEQAWRGYLDAPEPPLSGLQTAIYTFSSIFNLRFNAYVDDSPFSPHSQKPRKMSCTPFYALG